MAESKIEWTYYTFNPWRGCEKVSPGCVHCYAETLAKRNPKVLGEWGPNRKLALAADSYTGLPYRWRNEAKAAGERRRVFALSLGDWLDEKAPISFLFGLLADAIETGDWLDWLLLTKRPENWRRRLEQVVEYTSPDWAVRWLDGEPPANIWLGVSVEDQRRADERIPILLQTPAAVRFLSVEPLLGPVSLDRAWLCPEYRSCLQPDSPMLAQLARAAVKRPPYSHSLIDWVIVGGESGAHARPMHPDWARSLRDQCVAGGVPFFFKQWGEWRPAGQGRYATPKRRAHLFEDGEATFFVGKTKAGRLLDGREWNEVPHA